MSDLTYFEPMVDFLADFLGENAEIVLHDFSDLNQSIRKIRNEHISGRKKGDPITDLVAKEIMLNDLTTNYKCNYLGRSKNSKILKCATYYLRNVERDIIGAICINIDVDDFIHAQSAIDKFLNNIHTSQHKFEETNGITVPEMVDSRIFEIIESRRMPIENLTQIDKMEMVSQLTDEGIFLLKGTVAKVAKELCLSEPTIYKYVQKAK